MEIKACRMKNTIYNVKCNHCHAQIRRGAWVLALKDERMIIHPKCYGPVAINIMKLRASL